MTVKLKGKACVLVFKCGISRICSYYELPLNARLYVELIKSLGVLIRLISNGPRREAVIARN